MTPIVPLGAAKQKGVCVTESADAAPSGPREVFERLVNGVSERRWDEVLELYAEDAVVEHPFDLPAPSRLEGREQLRGHFAAAVGMPVEMEARNVVVHETEDPEVIVAEFEYHGRGTTTGRTFTIAEIWVTRVRSGEIVASRNYGNHLAFADAAGMLPEVVRALSEEGSA